MTSLWRKVRGAIGMGATWAVGWAIAGVSIGVASILTPGLPWERFFAVFDAPLPAFAVPGFVAGVFFSVVLGIAERRRRMEELSVPRMAAWGALGGVLLLLFPFALVLMGLASREGSLISTGQILGVLGVPFVSLGAASAALTLTLARRAKGGALRDGRRGALGGGDASMELRERASKAREDASA